MENKKGVSKGIIVSSIIIILLVVGIVCGAFYIQSLEPKDILEKTLNGGDVSLTYADEENLFMIENASPTSDIVGMKYDSAENFFDFTVRSEIEEANYIEYEIMLVKEESVSTLNNENIKIYLEKEVNGTFTKIVDPMLFKSNVSDSKFGNDVMRVYKQKKTNDGNDNYRLRMWIADTAVLNTNDVQNFGIKVAITGVAK